MVAAPRKELVELVASLYPLLTQRDEARVPTLKFVHVQLLMWAWFTSQRRGVPRSRRWYRMDPQDWADMALRVMLEYERPDDAHLKNGRNLYLRVRKVGRRL